VSRIARLLEPPLAFLIRTSSFLRKEIVEIWRQPRLVLTLVLGPFLILLLFGIGYQNNAPPLTTVFVVPEGAPIAQQIEAYVKDLGPQLDYQGITGKRATAMAELRHGQVDVVVVVPGDAYETIRSNKQAVLTLYHDKLDPVQANYVDYFGQIYVNEINRRVLRDVIGQEQSDATRYEDELASAKESAQALRSALEQGDAPAAAQHQSELEGNLSALELVLGASAGILGGVQPRLQPEENSGSPTVVGDVQAIRERTQAVNASAANSDNQAAVEQVAQIEQDLGQLETKLSTFQQLEPQVVVSPFTSEAHSIANIKLRPLDYYGPAAIVLLLQHLAITFAALSIVREQRLGTMELLRVAPISAIETMLSKYASYMLFSSVIAAILTAVLIFALRVPMLGNWLNFAGAMAALLFASLGVGFLISMLANTTSQAVQYSMLALLASVFFSGLFLNLETLWAPVRTVSWAIPATYGIQLLQQIMLRGAFTNVEWLLSLLGIGVVLAVVAWLMLRRTMARR
jgi:ABC-2 type transport system permease protein